MLFVTVHEGVHVYTSRNPSSLNVTTILVVGVVGDHAIRVRRIGLPAVDCSASVPHADAAHALVFRLLTPLVPVLERYPISASSIMIAPMTISSLTPNVVETEPMTMRVVPIETLPVSTAETGSPRKTWIFASALPPSASLIWHQTEYA